MWQQYGISNVPVTCNGEKQRAMGKCSNVQWGNTPYIAVYTPYKYVYTKIRNSDTAGGGWKIRRMYRTV